MASRFARHLTAVAPRGFAAVACAFLTAALVAPPLAQAQRHSGSVSVDLSVLDSLGTPQNVPQLLRPGVRSLLMPNAGQNANTQRSGTGFAPASPATPRGNAAPASTGFTLKPPSQVKRAAPAKPAQPRVLRKPVAPRTTPPAPPVIAAKPPAAPSAPSAPVVPQSASAPPVPVPPPAAPTTAARAPTQITPPPPPPAIAPPAVPPAAPPAAPAARPAPEAPAQTAALTPSATPRGKLAAGQQFRLMFGAGTASVENAAGTQLDAIAKALKDDEALRLQLLAYSGGGAQTPSQARRMSLSRALAVRSRLIKEGVRSTRIDVRALGNKSEGGPPDRVDVIVTKR